MKNIATQICLLIKRFYLYLPLSKEYTAQSHQQELYNAACYLVGVFVLHADAVKVY